MRKGVEFEEIDVWEDVNAIHQLAARGSNVTPTIVIGDDIIVGFDPAEIERALSAA